MRRSVLLRTAGLLIAGLATGCSLLGAGALHVFATAVDDVVTADSPAVIEVTAANAGDARVEWGEGSSTCQLFLVVRVDGQDRASFGRRVCTADLRTHALDPGEARTERIEWDGSVRTGGDGGSLVHLPTGTYEVRGAAGDAARSRPVLVTIED